MLRVLELEAAAGVRQAKLSCIAPGRETAPESQADARTRTGDPFITSEVLYQLSYVGGDADCSRGSDVDRGRRCGARGVPDASGSALA